MKPFQLMGGRAGLVLHLVLFFSLTSGYAQDEAEEETRAKAAADYTSYRLTTLGTLSTDQQTPFWIVGNRYGAIPLQAPNGVLQAGLYHRQPLGREFEWQAGIDLLAATPRYRNVYLQQCYASFAYQWLHLSIGSRTGEGTEAQGYNPSILHPQLSSGDLGLSANARPIPQINLYTSRFVPIPWTNGWIKGRGNLAVGRSFDTDYLNAFAAPGQTYLRQVLWHHKSLHLRITPPHDRFPAALTLGIRHFAQWGGVSTNPEAKPRIQPHALKDFLRILIGKSGGSEASLSDQVNVLGNHYGTYDFRLDYELDRWAIAGYYQHFFDDASGMEFNNTDGLIGIQLRLPPQLRWLQTIVLERLYTLNQSGPFHFIDFDHSKYPGYGGGGDNYYNNGEYTTGVSYFNRSLGTPFLLSPEYNADGSIGFQHNRIRAWHLGAGGQLTSRLSYRLLVSTMESFGIPLKPTLKKERNTSFAVDMKYLFRSSWTLSVSLAADRGTLLGDRIGCGISIAKQGIIRIGN